MITHTDTEDTQTLNMRYIKHWRAVESLEMDNPQRAWHILMARGLYLMLSDRVKAGDMDVVCGLANHWVVLSADQIMGMTRRQIQEA